MINKLTKKQIARQEEVKNYWINLALYSGDEIDEVEAKKGIDWLYTQANLPNVEMLVVDSPLGIQYAFNLLKNTGEEKKENPVSNSVSNSIRKSVLNSIGNFVRNSVWNPIENSIENSVSNSVRNSISNSVWNSVRNSVSNSIENSVSNSIENSVENEKLTLYEFNYQNLTNIGWFAFYDYFYDFDIYDEKTKENFNIYKNFLKSGVFFSACYSDIAIVSRRPIVVRKDDEGRLHSDQQSSIEWRDGYKLFHLDGVELPKDLWERIISKEMSLSEIMKIEISDQRTVALKYNPQAIIKEKAKLIHKDDRNNELYLIEDSEINKLTEFPKMYFLKMLCPTGRIFIEGVEPKFAEEHPNATECQAELCGLTLSEYSLMNLES